MFSQFVSVPCARWNNSCINNINNVVYKEMKSGVFKEGQTVEQLRQNNVLSIMLSKEKKTGACICNWVQKQTVYTAMEIINFQ